MNTGTVAWPGGVISQGPAVSATGSAALINPTDSKESAVNGQLAIHFLNDILGRHAGLALAFTWLAGIVILAVIYRSHRAQKLSLEQTLGALRFELEEARLDRPSAWDRPPPQLQSTGQTSLQFNMELDAYRKLWPRMNELHQAIGSFLRAIELRDNAAEKRLAARKAAAGARETIDAVMPFCSGDVEQMTATLLEKYVHIHLTACAYLDGSTREQLRALNRSEPVTIEVLHEQARTLYETQVRQELTALSREIRHRLSSLSGS